ncbi:MAG TPA: DUF3185 family protein [Opitutaceae bacterium]|nr:DUF3185 family protein [Opitutaceae bacterium]
MNKIHSLILVSAGAALIVVGLSGPESFRLAWSRFFAPAPAGVKVWVFLAGSIVSAIGLYRAWRDRSRYD